MCIFEMHVDFTNDKVNQLREEAFQCIDMEQTSTFKGTQEK